MIYLWVDIINDEEDEELTTIYNNLIKKINNENSLREIIEKDKVKDTDNYIDKMTNNLLNDNLNIDSNESISEKSDSNNPETEINEKHSNYYILNIDINGQKKIKINKNFLVWKENSCRFDSFIFLHNYGISQYISEE